MIAAVLAGDRAALTKHRQALAQPSPTPAEEWQDSSTVLLADGGSRIAHLDPKGRLVWLGSLRNFSVDLPSRWRGDFALAAAVEDELVLAKGRFGGRPLFYGFDPTDRSLVACSRLPPLVAALGDSSLSEDALGAYLVWETPPDAEQSVYRRIRRVPSACALRVGRDGVRSRQEIPCDVLPSRRGSADDLAQELREHIHRAVARATAGFDAVGLCVSGGVDSACLLATAMRVALERDHMEIRALNVSFEGTSDDRPHLRRLCNSLGIIPSRVEPKECGSALLDSLVVDGAPMGWLSACWDIRLTKMSRHSGAHVLLTGVGGDELLYGDHRLFADKVIRGHLVAGLGGAIRLKGLHGSTVRSRLRQLIVSPLARIVVGARVRNTIRSARRSSSVSWAGPRLRKLIRHGLLAEFRGSVESGRPTERSSLCELTSSPYYSEWKEERGQIEHAGGCARVEPFFDDDLVEFLASLRPDLLFHGGWSRGLFRLSMRDLVPEIVRMREDKADFESAFLQVVHSAGGFEVFRPLLTMVALADYQLVEPKAFRRRFDQLAQTPLDGRLWAEVWPVLAAEAFVRSTFLATS